jgi:hypothetical protein
MKRSLVAAGFLAVAACASAGPITIVSATGTFNGQAIADWVGETWTQTGTYTNVTITAQLNGGVALPTTANIYLLNDLGPGTTAGSNQIAYELETMPAGTHGVTLFTGLTLGPGTYYLLADEVDAGWTGSSSPVYTTDTGISSISAFTNTGAIAGYSPDTSYHLTSGAYIFSVTGTPTNAAPEPGTFALLSLGTAAVVLASRKPRTS